MAFCFPSLKNFSLFITLILWEVTHWSRFYASAANTNRQSGKQTCMEHTTSITCTEESTQQEIWMSHKVYIQDLFNILKWIEQLFAALWKLFLACTEHHYLHFQHSQWDFIKIGFKMGSFKTVNQKQSCVIILAPNPCSYVLVLQQEGK